MSDSYDHLSDRELLISLAEKSGEIALGYFKQQNAVRYKFGDSPVSEADDAIDDFLRESFAKARPNYGWLSEETEDNTQRLDKSRVVIADPIDGTRGFINGSDQWCISIAIVEDGKPVEAILNCPAAERMFIASHGAGLELQGRQPDTKAPSSKPLVTGSKKLIKEMEELGDRPFDLMQFVPSLAYRIALVAIGELDGAFARPGASEWDIAAADLILSESGGTITDKHGDRLCYNQKRTTMPALIAGSRHQHANILSLANASGIIK